MGVPSGSFRRSIVGTTQHVATRIVFVPPPPGGGGAWGESRALSLGIPRCHPPGFLACVVGVARSFVRVGC